MVTRYLRIALFLLAGIALGNTPLLVNGLSEIAQLPHENVSRHEQ